ncbi:MAG: hypothetical protein OER95_17260 [Acidimicrobiia bacterium]|nr:hypothetical protein [Acidimicrobiia bacterium]
MTETVETQPPAPAFSPHPAPAVQRRLNVGGFVAGIMFMAIGLAFILEADGRWTFQLSHFRYLGPLVLIMIGVATLVGTGLGRQRE